MARTEIYAGDTIVLTFSLTDAVLSDFDNIIAEAYTIKTNAVKFSLVEKSGFQTMEQLNTTTVRMKVLSAKSKYFSGDLFFEVAGIKGNASIPLEQNGIGVIDTTITVKNNYIKDSI